MAYSNAIIPKCVRKLIGTNAVQISTSSQLCYSFVVQNPSNATGLLFVGDSAIDATACLILSAGDSYESPVIKFGGAPMNYDLSGWYLRSNVATIKAKILRLVRDSQGNT